jgi:CBS domain-containing protein
LLAEYSDSGMLTSVLTALNDGVSRRVIELAVAEFGSPPEPWCWIVMGSEGRFEQTFQTDQDNGLIFGAEDSRQADALRPRFLPLAQQVNRYLDRCGIPRCTGGIMAGNPDCCLSIDEWKQRFQGWVRSPDPKALLNATIFFDFRPLYGDDSLAKELRDHLLRLTGEKKLFCRFLVENALTALAPIGRVRDFITERGIDNVRHIDLKKFGARLFVDAARVFALSNGSPETSTIARLRAAGPSGGINPGDVDSAVQAFAQVQRIRMTNQTRARPGSDGNLLDPKTLNRLDRKILRESLRQAQSLQFRLRTTYAIQ